ncbi:MAG: acyl-[acyl-carrier-protein]--UDP-N-acetylglucosamine O-acyltransferase [Elusimicrobia bacterium RIFCSPHIGHO2_01_FULL_64_10]|nr:MAG: acyl-[acyl-carrier-protein]--UDP-N-acetylglucosamine O-acyltransferase [Elusimicrobia bacterium RIFCSPHIGHO2_01_FULL_64_10]
MNIHPTAIVDPKAELAEGVSIGPYAVIGGQVRIGAGTRLDSHCVITGDTVIGSDNRVGVGAVIGLEPQDLAYRDWPSKVRIGNKNNIREYVQIHRGTKEGSATEIGDGNFLLGFSHVAHNCRVGDNVILANGALLAGYAEVGDRAFISGHCLVHQFCRIGPFAMMRGGARVSLDIPPYCVADDANAIRGINVIGMERGGVSAGAIREVKKVYREVFDSGVPLKEQVEKLLKADSSPEVRLFLEFIRSSERGVCRPAKV